MDLHQLRVFTSVYRNKSFSRASETLHLTQPTVSDHIKELELELGCRLFDRLGRGIMPTKEAEVLYRHAVEVIGKADEIKEAMGRFQKEVSGEVVIGASTIPGTYVLPHLMADFKKRYPAITFQIVVADSKEIVDKVLSHELLLGIVGAQLPNDQITFTPVMDDELIVVSSPSFTGANRLTLKQLVKMPLVLREEGSGTRREIERVLESRGITLDKVTIAGIFGSTDAVKQALKAGFGVSILSRVSVTDELTYHTLREIALQDLTMKRKFYLVRHKKRSLSPLYRAFVDHLKGNIR